MTFYEIDPGSGDSLIQSMYFPETPLNPTCTVWGCTPMISAWLQPIAYDTPTSPAKMTAEFAMSMPSAVFRNTGGCPAAAATAAMVGGAHFRAPVAPDSIAAIFGEALGTGTAQATSVPLPATLAGTSVAITDSRGTRHNSGLFYVSPGQVNAHVPAAVAPGNASLEVTRSDRVLSRGQVVVAPVAPALFSANATGAGPASAVAVRVTSSGTQIPQNIFSCAAGECSSIALDWGAESDTVVLLLFGTGIRGRGMLSLVVRVGSVTLVPDYAGPQGQFVGLDQVNVPLPRSLRGRGELPVTVVVGGLSSNAVLVRF
jgi:uncharacterized protein (TIGR03437 family)